MWAFFFILFYATLSTSAPLSREADGWELDQLMLWCFNLRGRCGVGHHLASRRSPSPPQPRASPFLYFLYTQTHFSFKWRRRRHDMMLIASRSPFLKNRLQQRPASVGDFLSSSFFFLPPSHRIEKIWVYFPLALRVTLSGSGRGGKLRRECSVRDRAKWAWLAPDTAPFIGPSKC